MQAEVERVLTREEIVELADAVAASGGIATGIGTNRYGAQLIVQADSRDEAVETATAEFTAAAARAGLPDGPIVLAEAVSEGGDGAGGPGAARWGDPRSRARGCSADGPRRGWRRSTRSCTSRSPTPSRTGTRSSTLITQKTFPRNAFRSSIPERIAGCGGLVPAGRSTSAPTRYRAGARRTAS